MKRIIASSLVALACGAGSVSAHEAGDLLIRFGATQVEPRESSDLVVLNGSALVLGGSTAGLGLDASTQLGVNFGYMLTNSLSVELLAATPFRHTATGTGALAGLDIAEVRQLPPTLSLIWHFPRFGNLQPYVGAGLNYTHFFKEKITAPAATTLAALGLRNGRVKVDGSVGASAQVGVDWHLTERTFLNASVRWIDLNTEAQLDFAGGSRLKVDVEVDPFVHTLAFGYTF